TRAATRPRRTDSTSGSSGMSGICGLWELWGLGAIRIALAGASEGGELLGPEPLGSDLRVEASLGDPALGLLAGADAQQGVGEGLASPLEASSDQGQVRGRIPDLAARLGERVEADDGRVDPRRRQEAATPDRADPRDRPHSRERSRDPAAALVA